LILPSKHISYDRALLSVGARILLHIVQPKTVSAIWEEMHPPASAESDIALMQYDEFVLALDLLFLLGAIDTRGGLLRRRTI
jgi:hypothetical protein